MFVILVKKKPDLNKVMLLDSFNSDDCIRFNWTWLYRSDEACITQVSDMNNDRFSSHSIANNDDNDETKTVSDEESTKTEFCSKNVYVCLLVRYLNHLLLV